MKRTPVRIRASSLGDLFDCPARWRAIHIEGRRSPQNAAAALGTAIHAGAAVYDIDRVHGVAPSVSAAEDAAVESVRAPSEETVWDEGTAAKAERVARSVVSRYCREESGWHDWAAVEASVESLAIEDLAIELTGHVDRVRRAEDGYGITDLKSGKQAVGVDSRARTKGHAAQLGVYELVAQAATGLPITEPAEIIGLQTNLTPAKQRIGVAQIEGAREALLGDEEKPGLLAIASKIVHCEIPAWGNPRSMMCHPNFCPAFHQCFWRR